MKPHTKRPEPGRAGRMVGLLLNGAAMMFALLMLASGAFGLSSAPAGWNLFSVGLGVCLIVLCSIGLRGLFPQREAIKVSHTHS